ncbi:unnamed protein product [Mytilus coruscus]|uniref:Uncharacterized protein n=1 Tax=Mytilus coruscus TaxID=42192 RepID=A0A6J8A1T2_MYTCO|nr:unnamed protein product [Mytilus coruscus]
MSSAFDIIQNTEVADLRMGGPTIFTPAEEAELAIHCIAMADKGYGYIYAGKLWKLLQKCLGQRIEISNLQNIGFMDFYPEIHRLKWSNQNDVKKKEIRSDLNILPHILRNLRTFLTSITSSMNQLKFGTLIKLILNPEFHKHMHENPNSVVTREQLPVFVNTACKSSTTVSNIMSGFRKTGIFNPEVVKKSSSDSVPTAAALSIVHVPTHQHERKGKT